MPGAPCLSSAFRKLVGGTQERSKRRGTEVATGHTALLAGAVPASRWRVAPPNAAMRRRAAAGRCKLDRRRTRVLSARFVAAAADACNAATQAVQPHVRCKWREALRARGRLQHGAEHIVSAALIVSFCLTL